MAKSEVHPLQDIEKLKEISERIEKCDFSEVPLSDLMYFYYSSVKSALEPSMGQLFANYEQLANDALDSDDEVLKQEYERVFFLRRQLKAANSRVQEVARKYGFDDDQTKPLLWFGRYILGESLSARDKQEILDLLDLLSLRLRVGEPPPDPRLPVIKESSNGGMIIFNDETYVDIDLEACDLLQELVEAYPSRIGLTTDDRPKPDRVIKKLPEKIRDLIDTNNKGSEISF